MKNIRIRGGNLEIASHTYYNEFTGRTMKIIGVCHVADDLFWDEVQESISLFEDAYPGSQVHFEGVIDEKLAGAKPDRSGTNRFCKKMGLIAQHNGLFYFDHWIRTDLKLSQIQAKMKDPDKLMPYVEQDKWLGEFADILEEKPHWVKRVHRIFRYLVAFMPQRHTDTTAAVLDARNHHAVSTMMTTGTDIITIWGAQHLHGMGKILTSSGYQLIDTEWNICISRPAGARHNLIGSK